MEGLRFHPKSFKLLFNISSAYIARNKIDQAIVSLEKARECDLMGQERVKENWVEERKVLIGKIIQAKQQKLQIKLRIDEIPLII